MHCGACPRRSPHSVVATGIARAGIETLTELCRAKVPRGRTGLLRENAQVQESVARAEAILGARSCFVLPRPATSGTQSPVVTRQHFNSGRVSPGRQLRVDSARQAMDLMYAGGHNLEQTAYRSSARRSGRPARRSARLPASPPTGIGGRRAFLGWMRPQARLTRAFIELIGLGYTLPGKQLLFKDVDFKVGAGQRWR